MEQNVLHIITCINCIFIPIKVFVVFCKLFYFFNIFCILFLSISTFLYPTKFNYIFNLDGIKKYLAFLLDIY